MHGTMQMQDRLTNTLYLVCYPASSGFSLYYFNSYVWCSEELPGHISKINIAEVSIMYKLIHGDCLEKMQQIPDKSIDLILCDLPYGMTKNKWDMVIPFDALWGEYNRIIKDNGVIALNCIQPFTSKLIMSNLKMFKYCWTWYKKQCSGFLNAKKQPLRNCEDIAIFYKNKPTYNPQMRQGKPQLKPTGRVSENYNKFTYKPHISEEYYPTTLLEIPLPRFKNGHPTQKPVALLEYLIKTYTNEGDLVLDNCFGSCSTGVACLNTSRNFIGIEKDDKYFEIGEKRMKEAELECHNSEHSDNTEVLQVLTSSEYKSKKLFKKLF